MLLEIVIPTKGRIQKLEQCINSIFISAKNIPIKLSLYFSVKSELDYFNNILKEIPNINLELIESYRVPEFWNSCLKNTEADIFCYLNDDVELFDNTIQLALKAFSTQFPALDGVLALAQSNLPEKEALQGAFGIIGKNFCNRFPNKQVFCPDYYRFRCDWELMVYAKKINKFYYNSDIKIKHYHPLYSNYKIDETHKDVRKYLNIDNKTFYKRQQLNYLWGENFNLVNEKNI